MTAAEEAGLSPPVGHVTVMMGGIERLVAGLRSELPARRVVTDADVLEAHRRDQAGLTDAGMPAVLVRAGSTADVQAVMRLAASGRVPVVVRGAGSGLAGGANAVDGCVILSLTGMDRITELNRAAMLAVVEPGVINADLGRAAAAEGLWYPPDPASHEFSTIGGNIATNAGGLCCVKYGVTRDSVLGLEVVLADGSVLRTGGRTRKNVAGYDLTSLFVGSEGTLGVVTSATLRLRPRPRPPSTLVAFFPTLASAGRAISDIAARLTPSLLELMDRATVRAVEDWRPMDLDTDAAALLLARCDDGGSELDAVASSCRAAGATYLAQSNDPDEGEMLMEARRLAYPALERLGSTLLDDVAVPIDRIPAMLEVIERTAGECGMVIGTFGHAGDGNLHPTIVFDEPDPASCERARSAFDTIVRAALGLGGTVTGEHGVGRLKQPYLAAEVGDVGVRVHRAVKGALDPLGIFNPGKLVG